MSKSLSPPEVVQALLDGKTVQRSGVTEMRWRGVTLEHRRKPAAVWVPSDATLDGFLYSIYNDVWYIVPTTYDWTEARKRMAAGKMVRSLSSPDDGSPGSYLCRQNEYGLYVREDGLAYEFNKADFDGRWEDA